MVTIEGYRYPGVIYVHSFSHCYTDHADHHPRRFLLKLELHCAHTERAALTCQHAMHMAFWFDAQQAQAHNTSLTSVSEKLNMPQCATGCSSTLLEHLHLYIAMKLTSVCVKV